MTRTRAWLKGGEQAEAENVAMRTKLHKSSLGSQTASRLPLVRYR
jgi:hypothetical protein